MPTHNATLPNGLKVIVREARHNPVVTVDAWVNTGSMNEPPAINGVSHFLEHMLFKGTERRGPNEIDLMIEAVGGYWNAATSQDYTHYYCTVASPYREVALDVVSDILRRSRIDAAELEKERKVIVEEWLRKQDDPGGLLWEEVYAASFAEGPYRRTVLGSRETIESIPRDAMIDYFERYYSPRNMVLVIAGDVAAEEAVALVERYFGDWDRAYRPFANPFAPTQRSRGARVAIDKEVAETYYALSFPAPSVAQREEMLALDVMESVLASGNSSRLHQRLVEQSRIAHGVGAGYSAHKEEGLFFVSGVLDEERLEDFRRETLVEIERMKVDGPTERELKRAKTMIFNGHAFSTETTAGQTSHIGYLHTLTGDTTFEETYLERLLEVSAADVRRVARAYLDPAATNEVVIRPRDSNGH